MISLVFGLVFIFSSITLAQEVNYVDQFGAFNYKYPIELLPGTNGMAPKLELVYNSNSGNGMLGIDWSLANNCGQNVVGAVTGVRSILIIPTSNYRFLQLCQQWRDFYGI